MLHGREHELDVLDRSLLAVRGGKGGALVLSGEPGMGKTALLRAAEARADGLTVLSATGVEAEAELAFAGLHQLLGPLSGTEYVDGLPEPLRHAVSAALGLGGPDCTDLVLYTAVARLLGQAAARHPVLVTVDDVQWWDRVSAAALAFAARRIATQPVLVLVAVSGEAGPYLAGLPALPLTGLPPTAAGAVFDEHAPSGSAGYRETVLAAAGGNPLALVELARTPAEVAEDDSTTPVVAPGSRLHRTLGARVRRMPADTRLLLLLLALDGTGRADVLAGAGLDIAALVPAEKAALVRCAGGHVRFRHPLLRALVRADADAAEIRAAHRTLADSLETSGEPERALWHRSLSAEGPDEDLAARLDERSAAVARCGGLAGAASVLRLAARLSTGPRRPRRLAAAGYAAWKSGQPDLARSLAAECAAHRNEPEVNAAIDRLNGLVALGDGDQRSAYDMLTRSAMSRAGTAPGEAVGLLFMAAAAAHHADLPGELAAAARRIVAIDGGFAEYGGLLAGLTDAAADAETSDPWRLRDRAPEHLRASDVHQWLWPLVLSSFGPRPGRAYEFGLEAVAEFTTNGMHAIVTMPELWLAELAFELGFWEQSGTRAAEGLRSAHDTGQRSRQADFHAVLAMLAATRGESGDCRDHARRCHDLAIPLGNRLAAARASWALGLLELARGNHDLAVEHLAALRDPAAPTAHGYLGRLATADLVEAHLRAGQRNRARQAADTFAPWANASTSPLARSRLARCRALLSEHDDDTDKLFTTALATAAPDHPFEQARTALLHGEWLRRVRRPARARPLLRQAHEIFRGLGARVWAHAAAGQLRPTGAEPVAPSGGDSLTHRELQVVRLAAGGLSNREIGARLFLSPRTVGHHLYRAFPKLGVANRAQLRSLEPEELTGG
ncbi:regulatory LuxR family protein [Prauserella shujinwangii]|uniref:Regulatory LuxR family protein n=1 Tax=Prauserella shujinwangii TaxID=1453103 RepID=A0A2T0LN01_9PSEU|nr:helix-turn-helix transcriptional regulator [Prauserella shujinwangii]PRX44529.1 regulatory LuxR family protein [Prauserella shujinwangii]